LSYLERFQPEVHAGIQSIAEAWNTRDRQPVLEERYPKLKKISVDYGIMEPASADPGVPLLAIPMMLDWHDIGSWTSYAETRARDAHGNTAPSGRSVLVDCTGTLVASTEPGHLIAAVGCEDLIIVHTANATLVCPKARAEEIKDLQARIRTEHGEDYV
jgi:mannose-1-phosphate guanylyltransferase